MECYWRRLFPSVGYVIFERQYLLQIEVFEPIGLQTVLDEASQIVERPHQHLHGVATRGYYLWVVPDVGVEVKLLGVFLGNL